MKDQQPLLETKNLAKQFLVHKHKLHALSNISLSILPGETLGILGESGSGKTTLGKTILRLYQPTSGTVHFDGKDLGALSQRDLKAIRRKMQIVFQDPYSSLNPRMMVQDIVGEGIVIQKLSNAADRKEKVEKLLHLVGLKSEHLRRFPGDFSGGQRQRIGIARALAVDPQFIVLDEPVSSLDPSIQIQILQLLKKYQTESGVAYLLISHDLGALRFMSDRICVMYLGRIVELGDTSAIAKHPLHPYTQALVSAVPVPDPKIERNRTRILLSGDPPSPLKVLAGCPFQSGCPRAKPLCRAALPELKKLHNGHWAACHFLEES